MTLKVVEISNFHFVPEECKKAFKLPKIAYEFNLAHTEDEIVDKTKDADIIMILPSNPILSRKNIEALPKLRYVLGLISGYNGLDVKACTDNGIIVTTSVDVFWEDVSDHAMALMLSWSRQIIALNEAAKGGEWEADRIHSRIGREINPKLDRLQGRTLGLVGFGGIARSLAQKANAFGMRIVASDPYVTPGIFSMFKVEPVSMDTLLKESDYISIHAFLSESTRNLISMKQLKMMKPNAFLINTARGPIVNHKDLYEALTNNIIAGAGLDAFDPEPATPETSPLLKLNNVIVTCHRAGDSITSNKNVAKLAVEQVFRVARGEWPLNILNPEVKEKYTRKWPKIVL